MNIATMISETNPLDREAAALANVQRMRDDLIAVREENAQLKADLHREQDRCVMLLEERDRYRHESVRFRKLALRQAVKMVNAALIMEEAKETIHEIDEIDEAPTPPTDALDKLETEFAKGNADCHITTPNEGRG